MITAITIFCFLAIFVNLFSGLVVGYRRARKREENKVQKTPKPFCPCGHSIGEHQDGAACLSETRRPHYDSIGNKHGHEWVKCMCTKYYGPKPIEEFYHPGTFLPLDSQ